MNPPNGRARAAPTENAAALAFIAHAIIRHAAIRRRDGLPVPALAVLVAKWCADQARSGEVGQRFDSDSTGADVGIVNQLLLTDKDTGALLGVSARTVRAMIADGRMPAIKVGGATRIRRSDVDAFIAGQPATTRFRDNVAIKDAADVAGGAT